MSTLRYNVITKIKKIAGKIYPSLNRIYGGKYGPISDVWENPKRKYPSVVYVETTNHCNAKCVSCLNHLCKRERGTMTLENFKIIADKVKANGAKIGAMFCFGEPLMDKGLFKKFKYAMEIDVLTKNHVGLNTNVTFLTSKKFDDILKYTPNIVLSFFNVGKEYERLTGGLNWKQNYKNATDFIKYRDKHKPDYPIFIGTNKIKDNSFDAVRDAFKDYNVIYTTDAEILWGGSIITGVLNRMILFNDWRCDGYKGAMHIKWNGNCEFCAYDIVGTPNGGESSFGNIFTDSWEELSNKFKTTFKNRCSLCKRCEYWYHCKDLMNNDYKRPNPLPNDWYDWQKTHLKKDEEYYD